MTHIRPSCIDTHLHLGGCIPPEFVWEIIQEKNLKYLAETYDDVLKQMTFGPDEQKNFYRFLDKFRILDEIKWDEDLLDRSIAAVSQYLAFNNIDYAWLDFSINKYMCIGWHKIDAIQFIHESFQRHYPNRIGLILSLKYESMRASQRQYAKLIEDPRIVDILVGLDLVGDEAQFDSEFYKPLFHDWNKIGKMTRAHVGESQHHNNILATIQNMEATNVAHGIKIIQDPNIVALARERQITFDLSITSNFITGIWQDPNSHPIKDMIDNGLSVTIGSDDPVQCQTNLINEYQLAKKFGVTDEQEALICQKAFENIYKYDKNGLH